MNKSVDKFGINFDTNPISAHIVETQRRESFGMGEDMSGSEFKVSVILERREDGGLRAYSDDVPGLILSSKNIDGLLSDVPVVLSACLSHTLGKQITVAPLPDLKDILSGNDGSNRAAPGTKDFLAHIH